MKIRFALVSLVVGTGLCFAANKEKTFNNKGGPQHITVIPRIIKTEAGEIDFGLIESIPSIPGLFQRLKEVGQEKDTFKLDNESKWMASEIETLKGWAGDDLILTQNQAIFSTYRFALINPHLQKAEPISLSVEPLPIKDKTFFIDSIDIRNDVVKLENNTEWAVHSGDHGTLRKFAPHDRVMFGVNSSDRIDNINHEKRSPYILINTTHNLYVRVSKI